MNGSHGDMEGIDSSFGWYLKYVRNHFRQFFNFRKPLLGWNASGPRSARPTGSTASSASGRLRRKVGMVEMIRLADEPWAPVAQGHPGAEVVRSVRVALRGTKEKDHSRRAAVGEVFLYGTCSRCEPLAPMGQAHRGPGLMGCILLST